MEQERIFFTKLKSKSTIFFLWIGTFLDTISFLNRQHSEEIFQISQLGVEQNSHDFTPTFFYKFYHLVPSPPKTIFPQIFVQKCLHFFLKNKDNFEFFCGVRLQGHFIHAFAVDLWKQILGWILDLLNTLLNFRINFFLETLNIIRIERKLVVVWLFGIDFRHLLLNPLIDLNRIKRRGKGKVAILNG